MTARTVLALATHGLSYTPAQVRAMTRRDRDALLSEAKAVATEADRGRALAAARAQARSGRKR